tara:strand:- start:32 stop:160 length:129 start_codon:yes stop_codon:yes gene_type:complete
MVNHRNRTINAVGKGSICVTVKNLSRRGKSKNGSSPSKEIKK